MKTFKKFFLIFCVLLFISCGSEEKTKDTLNINIGIEPPTLDWSLAVYGVSFEVINNIMDGLATFDEEYRPVPSLAESWQVSEDETTYTFKIREGVLWTDGKPLTSGDFLYAWQRLLQSDTKAGYAYFLFDIQNARQFNEGKITNFAEVGVKAPDDRTLVVVLEKSRTYFLSLVTFMSTFPMRQDIVEKHGDKWTTPENIVTLGPYVLKKWEHEKEILIEEYGDYWGEGPKDAKKVKMIMERDSTVGLELYEKGELDFLDSLPPSEISRLREHPDFSETPVFSVSYVGFNTRQQPFDDPLVRKAFASSIDRERLIETLGSGKAITSFIPVDMFAHNPEIGLPFDAPQAGEFLDMAGYPDGEDFPEVTFLYVDSPNNNFITEMLRDVWKSTLGVDVTLEPAENSAEYLEAVKAGSSNMYRTGWGADFPDPHTFMSLFEAGSGNNYTGWEDSNYDKLVKMAAEIQDQDERKRLYDQAQKILTETAVPIAPYLNSVDLNLIKPYVKGLEPPSFGILSFSEVEFTDPSVPE